MSENTTLSIAVLSGKGGVGKSNIALNLAFSLNLKGEKVLLLDCDLGLANLDVLLGLVPQQHMHTLLAPESKAEDVIIKLNDSGLDLLPANSGMLESFSGQQEIMDVLLDRISGIIGGYDFVILDIGAGIGSGVLAFGAMTQMRLLVITPEPTSLTDSYALIKVLEARYGVRDHFIVVNQVSGPREEEQSFKRISSACEHFLKITPQRLGRISTDKNLPEAVRRQKPLVTEYADSIAVKDFMALAEKLQKLKISMQPFISKLPPLRRPGT